MKNKVLLILSVVMVLAMIWGGSTCQITPPAPPTAIKIGAVRSMTGGLETIALFAFDPVMNYWLQQVTGAGGIYLSNYGYRLPVEIAILDDTSDIDIMKTLLTGMVTSDHYHFVFPPCSTAHLQAAARICTDNQYVLLGAEGGCKSIENSLDDYQFLFSLLNYSTWNQMEKLFEILRYCQDNKGANDPMYVYIISTNNTHGIEYRDAFVDWATINYAGHFIIVGNKLVPPGEMDVSNYLLQAANNATDLFCSFTYPPTSLQTIRQAVTLHINFDGMLVGPGANFEYTLLPPTHPGDLGVGAGNMTGVMGFGAWNEYSSPILAEFAANMTKFDWLGLNRTALDWWGHAPYYAGLQCFQQAIERMGEIDSRFCNLFLHLGLAMAGYDDIDPFDTILGPAYFTKADGNRISGTSGGLLAKDCYAGQISQWQYNTHGDGKYIYEVIDLGTNNTADVVWPKQNWP